MFCPKCGANLIKNHILEDTSISPMKNKSRILHPKCAICQTTISVCDVDGNIDSQRKVLLISGTAGAGKTALGQLIEAESEFIFIDGDAISKRTNHFARSDSSVRVTGNAYQIETINTMLVVLALGYNVVAGYVISPENLSLYSEALTRHGIEPTFCVLVPNRATCLERDIIRECWTAGAEYVDRWYEEQRSYLLTHPSHCIDTSDETLEETYHKHFESIVKEDMKK